MQQIAMAQWAHDIRNALGTVSLYVETLRRRADPRTNDTVASAHALLKKAAAMCNEAVCKAGRGAASRETFDVTGTMREIRDLVAPTLPASASITVVAAGSVHVAADAQDVFRILFNLVHNATTLARQSGSVRHIRLEAKRVGGTAVLVVADDGPGLPDSVKAQLFRPGHSGLGSTGLGLSIARELAERNGGMLELVAQRRGTAFAIELPLHMAMFERVPRHAAPESLRPGFA
jgi:signal transduction histidine kinase